VQVDNKGLKELDAALDDEPPGFSTDTDIPMEVDGSKSRDLFVISKTKTYFLDVSQVTESVAEEEEVN